MASLKDIEAVEKRFWSVADYLHANTNLTTKLGLFELEIQLQIKY